MAVSNLKLLITVLRTEGAAEVLSRLAFRFFHVHSFPIYRMALSGTLPNGQVPEGIEFREVSLEEFRELRRDRTDLPEYFYRDLTDETLERCWVGLSGGKLGFVTWISYRGSSELVRFSPTEAEVAYIYCLKDLRGKRLTTNAMFDVARTLKQEGTTCLWAVPNSRNAAIIKSFLSCGFVKVGTVRRYFGLFTWPRTPVDTLRYSSITGEAV
jgi:RimJ/RimL family protein N-acetyltransferase